MSGLDRLEDLVGDVERFIQDLVADLEQDPVHPGPGRPRIVPSLALWAGLLVCVLRGWFGQRALWRVLSLTGLWHDPRPAVTDEAVSRRLVQAGTAPLERLFRQVSTLLAARLATWPLVGASTLAPFAARRGRSVESLLDDRLKDGGVEVHLGRCLLRWLMSDLKK